MTANKNIISRLKGKHILVIGDLILDQHIKGTVTRISPEAPVPVVLQEKESLFAPGGAANVANNLRSLGARVTLVGRIGKDAEGKIFLKEIKKRNIFSSGIFLDNNSPTILKTRILSHHQQVLRLDRERLDAVLSASIKNKINTFIQRTIKAVDAVIISDYGKGLISAELLLHVSTLARQYKKILIVDPKDDHFSYYREVTAITPNKKEAENAIRNIKISHPDHSQLGLTSDRLVSLSDVERAGRQLRSFLKLECLLITLGEQGMYLFEKGKDPVHIPTRAKEVFDVTGAGDTVISVFTLCLAAGASKFQAADLANHAAGIVVAKMGTATVSKEELIASIKGH